MNRVLVTGGTGFIGRYCLARLAAVGYEVHSISRNARPVTAVRWHRCNLLDVGECRRAIESVRPTHLLHLAWLATPGVFWDSTENLQWLESSVSLFRAFFDSGGRKAVGLGTCAEYESASADLEESTANIQPSTVYGQCKAAAGFACLSAAQAYKASALWVRLFYPYGPGEPKARLIPSVIAGLSQERRVVCSEGTQVRDFIFVQDVADALERLLSSDLSGFYNLGSGHGATVREVVMAIAGKLARPDLIVFDARSKRENDPPRIVANVNKLQRDLNWRPPTSLLAGLAQTIEESRANHN